MSDLQIKAMLDEVEHPSTHVSGTALQHRANEIGRRMQRLEADLATAHEAAGFHDAKRTAAEAKLKQAEEDAMQLRSLLTGEQIKAAEMQEKLDKLEAMARANSKAHSVDILRVIGGS